MVQVGPHVRRQERTTSDDLSGPRAVRLNGTQWIGGLRNGADL